MALRQRLTVSLFALLICCSPLVAAAGPPGHSRHHQKHARHDKHHKAAKHHKHHKYADHHNGHRYAKRHKRHDHGHHRHHEYHRHHEHEHVVIVEPYQVPDPRPGVDVEIETGGVTIEGGVLF